MRWACAVSQGSSPHPNHPATHLPTHPSQNLSLSPGQVPAGQSVHLATRTVPFILFQASSPWSETCHWLFLIGVRHVEPAACTAMEQPAAVALFPVADTCTTVSPRSLNPHPTPLSLTLLALAHADSSAPPANNYMPLPTSTCHCPQQDLCKGTQGIGDCMTGRALHRWRASSALRW